MGVESGNCSAALEVDNAAHSAPLMPNWASISVGIWDFYPSKVSTPKTSYHKPVGDSENNNFCLIKTPELKIKKKNQLIAQKMYAFYQNIKQNNYQLANNINH